MTTLAAAKDTVTAFNKAFPGGTSPFGAPNYVLAQAYAEAISSVCKAGNDRRATTCVRNWPRSDLSDTLLGTPLSFTANGDVKGAKFFIFKIENGKYVTLSSSSTGRRGRRPRLPRAARCG